MQSSVQDGKFEMSGLAPGVYDLFATLRGGRVARAASRSRGRAARGPRCAPSRPPSSSCRTPPRDEQDFFWYEVRCDGALVVYFGLDAGDTPLRRPAGRRRRRVPGSRAQAAVHTGR
jgi:hypothetical protein